MFQHIARLYAAAEREIAAGRWRAACGATLLHSTDGREYRMQHVARRSHELGELLIGRQTVAWLIEPAAADLYQAGLATLRNLSFGSTGMREQLSGCLPGIQAALKTQQHEVLVSTKGADMVLLADLMAHLGGRLPPGHTAWVLSCLYNIACYLQWAGLTHNAIGPETVFVSPSRHACALLGGWWYAVPEGGRLVALPKRSADALPPYIVASRRTSARADLELIRATGRELLGDASGVRLLRDPQVPPALAQWLQHPCSGSAVNDYRQWRQTLRRAFGEPRFRRLEVSVDEIYPLTDI